MTANVLSERYRPNITTQKHQSADQKVGEHELMTDGSLR